MRVSEWRSASAALFLLGLVLSAAHVAVALEVATTLSMHGALVKSLILLMYPVALAFLGMGAALDRLVLRSDDPSGPLRAGGVSLLAFLAVSLRWNFLPDEVEELVVPGLLHALVLGAWFLCAGVALARLVRAARQDDRTTSWLWAVHQVGLVVGYLVQDPLVPLVGVNALLLVIGLSLLLPKRLGIIGLLLGCLFAPSVHVDQRLEDLRDLSALAKPSMGVKGLDRAVEQAMIGMANGTTVTRYFAWSRFGQFRLVEIDPALNYVTGWYNFHPQWDLNDPRTPLLADFREQLYQLLRGAPRVAIMGVGGGRGLMTLPDPDQPGLTAIERDGAVVHYFRDIDPTANERVFQRIQVVAGDGRQFIERQAEPFDIIVIESARYQPAHSLFPASAPIYLYTREAIEAMVGQLSEDGLFIAGFTDVRATPLMEFLPIQVARSLGEAGMHTIVITPRDRAHVHMLACKSERCAERVAKSVIGRSPTWTPSTLDSPIHEHVLSDDNPFGTWTTMSLVAQRSLLATVSGVGVLGLFLGGLVWRRGRSETGWNPVPYFFLLGIGHSALSLVTCYAWRTYFVDDVLTVVRVLVYLIGFGAIGSALSHRLRAPMARSWVRVVAATGFLGVHVLAWSVVPFGEPSGVLREVFAAVLLAPGGLAMGVFFPLGLTSVPARQVGLVLLADALGTLVGYTLLYLVALPLGIRALGLVCVTIYAVAALAWRKGSPDAVVA